MFKHLKINAALILAAAAILAAPAAAQNASNPPLGGGSLKEKFSFSDVSSILGELGIASRLIPATGDEGPNIVAVTPGGARFIVSMLSCDDASAGTGCKQFLLFTGLSNAGLSYDDLNSFNVNSTVAKAMNMVDQQVVLFGLPVIATGGIGRNNFRLSIALYLNDMQNYVTSKNNATSVSLSILSDAANSPEASGKLRNETAGAEATAFASGSFRGFSVSADLALTVAVANTYKVDFLTEDAKKLVD